MQFKNIATSYKKKVVTTRIICGKLHVSLLTQLWLINLLPSLIAQQWVGPQTRWRLPLQSISDGPCLTTNVCGRAYHGPVCGLLVFWLQIAIEPFVCFHLSVFIICVALWCLTDEVDITKTYLYNFDPHQPQFDISKTRVYRGIHFLISAQKHILWVLVRTASQKYEKY